MEKLKNKIKRLEEIVSNQAFATLMTFTMPIYAVPLSYFLSTCPEIDMGFTEILKKGFIYMAKTPISEIYGEFLKRPQK